MNIKQLNKKFNILNSQKTFSDSIWTVFFSRSILIFHFIKKCALLLSFIPLLTRALFGQVWLVAQKAKLLFYHLLSFVRQDPQQTTRKNCSYNSLAYSKVFIFLSFCRFSCILALFSALQRKQKSVAQGVTLCYLNKMHFANYTNNDYTLAASFFVHSLSLCTGCVCFACRVWTAYAIRNCWSVSFVFFGKWKLTK